MMLILIDCCLPVLVVCLMSGEHAPCKNRTGVAKGLHDRNSPICTLSQNGYGGKSRVPFSPFNLDQKSSGMASQGLGSLQDASQDVGDISKIGTWECWSSPTFICLRTIMMLKMIDCCLPPIANISIKTGLLRNKDSSADSF